MGKSAFRFSLGTLLVMLVVALTLSGACGSPAPPPPTPPTPPTSSGSQPDAKAPVSTAAKTITFNPVAQETGSVDSDGDKDNSKTVAGDDDKNVGYCAFWNFDIGSLQGATIENAKLIFPTARVTGDPFSATTGLKGLRLWEVKYSDKLPGFQYTGTQLERGGVILSSPPTVVDVTPEIGRLAKAAGTKFQIEVLFMSKTNGNSVAERVEWLSPVVLEVTYSGK